jgi:formylglycine-generating enzyme required for sulfatase activity
VGVSWLQASDYCIWRTNRVNEQLLLKAGQITAADLQNNKGSKSFDTETYNQGVSAFNKAPQANARPVVLFTSYRLPTEAEWEYAARPQELNKLSGLVESEKIYPWAGATVRSQGKNTKGHLMANFQKGRGDLKGPAGTKHTNAPTPLPVTSYYPNHLGLYNMAGNVNEWVLDVYRPLSYRDVEDSRPYRGNVAYQYKRDAQGNLMIDSLGRLIREVAQDVSGARVDYRSYRDGDAYSNQGMNAEMYSNGKGQARDGAASLISNTSRVYKGGSFIDRAYWLNPATRRFLEEDKSQVDLGFRCVMDYFGPR